MSALPRNPKAVCATKDAVRLDELKQLQMDVAGDFDLVRLFLVLKKGRDQKCLTNDQLFDCLQDHLGIC